MRYVWLFAALLLTACAPEPVKQIPRDPTTEPWYADTLRQLTDMNSRAKDLFHKGRGMTLRLLFSRPSR
jgi:hypothetical protein